MPTPRADRWMLERTRGALDGVDDGLILLLAMRRRLVRLVAMLKRRAGVPGRDVRRERQVRARAQRLALSVGVPAETARSLLDLAIGDACLQQGIAAPLREASFDIHQGRAAATAPTMGGMPTFMTPASLAPRLLRWLPPPRRVAPLLRVLPSRWPRAALEAALARLLATPLRDGSLDFMDGRRLGVEATDLGLRWVLTLRQGRLCVVEDEPEASARGSATDLLLLAGRLEDADTLFFQRVLVLTGDTELGLTARNLLERLPWEGLPLGLRIPLNRGARLARAARDAHRRAFR